MEIDQGEFVCVVGPSGCGKSTLLRIVAGLLNPTAGGIDVYPRSPDQFDIAMVFQDYGIYPWKTVRQNVRFGLDLLHIGKRESNQIVDGWLERFGLTDFAGAFPRTLSGGMKQRVSIARALAPEPEILLMDEPFAALDAQMRLVLQEELLQIWEQDRRTVMFVTHSLEEAILLGDRVVMMSARPGRILSEYSVRFERPRKPEIRGTPEFAELHEEIWEQLRQEVNTSSGPDQN
jgi:NitT/TauT family transport system ATP-binding protein